MSLGRLFQQHPAVAARITRFEPLRAAALAAGLQLFPDLRANFIRLELLALIVTAKCRGIRVAQARDLPATVNGLEKMVAHLEDPIEDVLVANVSTAHGNRLVLTGRWESPDFWLQQTLDAYGKVMGEDRGAYDAADALLWLSDLLLARAGLDLDTEGDGEPNERPLSLPTWGDMAEAADWVTFRTAELEAAGVDVAQLESFVYTPADDARSLAAEFDYAVIHQKPLLRAGDRWVVAMPCSLGRAAHLLLLRAGTARNLARRIGGWMLRAQQDELRNAVLKMKGKELPLRFMGEGRPPLGSIDFACSFDRDKACLFLLLLGPAPHEPTSAEDELAATPDDAPEVQARVDWCLAQLGELGFKGGLIIILAGGGGGGIRLQQLKPAAGWHHFSTSLPNLVSLAAGEDATFLRMWRMTCAREATRADGTKIANMSDDFNLFCHWQQQGFRIVPADPAGKKYTYVGVDSASYAEARREGRRSEARHATWHPREQRWIPVERFNAHAYFSQLRTEPYFVDGSLNAKGMRASIETDRGGCWIDAAKPEAAAGFPLLYNLWKCVAHWVLAVLLKRPAAVAKEERSDVIHLALEDGTWDRQAILGNLEARSPLAFELKDGVLRLTITVGYLRSFADVRNVAERDLVGVLLRFLHGDGAKLLDDVDVATVVSADDQRFFHLIPRPSALRIDAADSPPPKLIPGEVHAEARRMVTAILRRIVAGRQNLSKEDTNNIILAAVPELHGKMLKILGDYARESVIRTCLDNQANAAAERDLWYLTAAANLATNPDPKEVREVAFEREAERSVAAQTSRLIVEAALIVTPKENAGPLTLDAFERLMALCEALVLLANHADAVMHDVAKPGIEFDKDGESLIDTSTYERIARPLHTAAFDFSFTEAAAQYADAFTERALHEPSDRDRDFMAAFLAEFGFSVESMAKAEMALQRKALGEKSRLLKMHQSAMVAWLVQDAEIPEAEATNMTAEMSLRPRSGFGQELPAGTAKAEEYPWRYRRRLSVLWRPIVALDKADDPELIVCADLFATTCRYRCYHLYAGLMPANRMRSQEMKELIGDSALQRGHEFSSRVNEHLKQAGLQTWFERELESLGAPAGPRGWGDVDVLAYHAPSGRLTAIECKHLVQVRSVSEMVLQMADYRGKKGDDLWKHDQRVNWLKGNLATVAKRLGLPGEPKALEDYVATGSWAPMSFDEPANRPERFVHVSELCARIGV